MSTTLVPPTEQLGTLADRPRVGVAGPKRTRERLLSLDVFRGLTVAGMLLVNDPGTWSAIYPPLEHATWNGWTPTDLVFPFFLFIVGITTHLSLTARRERKRNQRSDPTTRRADFFAGISSQRLPIFHLGQRERHRRSDVS